MPGNWWVIYPAVLTPAGSQTKAPVAAIPSSRGTGYRFRRKQSRSYPVRNSGSLRPGLLLEIVLLVCGQPYFQRLALHNSIIGTRKRPRKLVPTKALGISSGVCARPRAWDPCLSPSEERALHLCPAECVSNACRFDPTCVRYWIASFLAGTYVERQ